MRAQSIAAGSAPGAKVEFDAGENPASAAALAKKSDVAIVFAYQWISEGMDLPNLSLPDQQDALVYGALLGWRIKHEELPAPLTESITPMLELDGSRPFTAAGGQDALSGVIGANLEFESIGHVQPALSIGWEFPIDQGARDQFRWGIIAQLFLSF